MVTLLSTAPNTKLISRAGYNPDLVLDAMRQDLSITLEEYSGPVLKEAILQAVVTYGGTYVSPTKDAPQDHTLTILSVTGMGDSFEEAYREWCKGSNRPHRELA